MRVKIYSDGACRGNPGPSAIAYAIYDHEGRLLKEDSKCIGVGTNNQAEYKAIISALDSAMPLGDELICYMDSELVVKQMNGEYRVTNPRMRKLWKQAITLTKNFKTVIFQYVPRIDRFIKRLDYLANQELDKNQ